MSDGTMVTVADTELPAQDVLDAAEQYLAGDDIVRVNGVVLADDKDDDRWVNVYFADIHVGFDRADSIEEQAQDALTDDFEQIPNDVGADLYYDGDNTVRLGDGTTAPASDVIDAVKDVSNPALSVNERTVGDDMTIEAVGWAPWSHSPSVAFDGCNLRQTLGAAEVLSALE